MKQKRLRASGEYRNLLDQQIDKLECQFVEKGGYSEALANARREERMRNRSNRNSDESIPSCPNCGQGKVLRTANNGVKAGQQFWGCSKYPDCRVTLPLDRPSR